jgi:hypothetical protein
LQWLLFKHFWGAFLTIERCNQTLHRFGDNEDDPHFMVSGGKAVSMNDFDIDPGNSNCTKEELIR